MAMIGGARLFGAYRWAFFPTVMAWTISAALHDPFPMGYAMGNFGTILWGNGVTGRQPWIPAAFLQDSGRFGLGVAYVDYYDPMDNMADEQLRQSSIGGWVRIGKLVGKGSFSYFNALNVYFEQKGYASVGTSAIPFVNVSIELEGFRAALRSYEGEEERMVHCGFSALVPWSFASASLSCQNVVVERASEAGFSPPFCIAIGIHTTRHRFGAQGVVLEIEPGSDARIRFHTGMEVWIHRMCAFDVGFKTNPFMIGFGALFSLSSSSICAAVVHHPVLGWSKGIGTEYRGSRRAGR